MTTPSCNTARPYYIPQDIIELFLDNLEDSKDAIANCSLVCRSWLNPGRRRLFRVIDLYATRQSGDDTQFAQFAEFLHLTSPTICSCIRELRLWGKQLSEPVPPVEHHVLVRLLSPLSRLHKLSFIGLTYLPPQGFSQVSAIRDLEDLFFIGMFENHSCPDLLCLLRMFSAIKRLNIVDVNLDKTTAGEEQQTDITSLHAGEPMAQPRIRHLTLWSPRMVTKICRMSSAVPSFRCLDMLDIDIDRVQVWVALGELFSQGNTIIGAMRVSIPAEVACATTRARRIDLETMPWLALIQAITIHIDTHTSQIDSMPASLSELSHGFLAQMFTSIRGIAIRFDSGDYSGRADRARECCALYEAIKRVDFAELERVMNRFTTLRAAIVHLDEPEWTNDERDIIRKGMPGLVRKGILQVSDGQLNVFLDV